MNPVNGAVGLLWTGNWSVCQAAVETVLRGGSLRPIPELLTRDGGFPLATSDEVSEICMEMMNDSGDRNVYHHSRFSSSRSRATASPPKRRRLASEQQQQRPSSELDFSMVPAFPIKTTPFKEETRRPETPYSEESVTTAPFLDHIASERFVRGGGETTKLLNLFAWTALFFLFWVKIVILINFFLPLRGLIFWKVNTLANYVISFYHSWFFSLSA